MSGSPSPSDSASAAMNGLFQGALSLLNGGSSGSNSSSGSGSGIDSSSSNSSNSSNNSNSSGNNNGSRGGQKAAPASEASPDDIPKEDLVHLCMKMNKKMQAMELKGQELAKKKNMLLSDKHTFIEFINNSIPLRLSIADDEAVDKEVLNSSWGHYAELQAKANRALEEKNKSLIQELAQSESRYHQELMGAKGRNNGDRESQQGNNEDSSTSSSPSVIDLEIRKIIEEKEDMGIRLREADSKIRHLELELDKARVAETSLNDKTASGEKEIASKTEKFQSLQKDFDAHKAQSEEKILYLQIQLNSCKSIIDARDKELLSQKKTFQTQISALKNSNEEKELTVKNDKDVITMFQKKLMYLEPEIERYRETLKENEKHLSAALVMKAEQDGLIDSLRRDLRVSVDRREEEVKKSKESEENRSKAESLQGKVLNLTEQLNISRSELEEQQSLVTRMKSEAQISERNYAMKTAMLATCEAQLDALKALSVVKDDTIKETMERVAVLQTRLSSSESRCEEKVKDVNNKYAELEKEKSGMVSFNETQMQVLKKAHEEALEAQKRDFSKKSSLARTLLSEREEEVRVLTNRVKDLQSEITSGAPSERKIFELAQMQAKRDALHGIHGDSREFAFLQLQKSLTDRDFELADAVQKYSELNVEVEALRRVSRRETVNMDYLKNVVLQFMTFPVYAPERLSLVPVICTLLQFNPKEVIEVEKVSKDPNANTRPVKEIRRSLQNASMMSTSLPSSSHGTSTSTLPTSISIVPMQGNSVYTPGAQPSSSSSPSSTHGDSNNDWLDSAAHNFKLASPKSKIVNKSAGSPTMAGSPPSMDASNRGRSNSNNGGMNVSPTNVNISLATHFSVASQGNQNNTKKYTSISL